MPEKALSGIKVLEYAQLVSGPYCGKLLADLGAEVIKIEKPSVGDEARKRGPFSKNTPHNEKSGLFFYLNSNKFGVTLDPYTNSGKKILKQMIKESDIFIEDKSPTIMKKLGLDYSSLDKLNHHLIVTSITPFGQTGPYKDYKAYHLNCYGISSLAKILSNILPEDYPLPIKVWGYLGDYDCGLSAAVATMGALYARLYTNKGQHVDVSKQESLIALERPEIGMYGNEKDPNKSTVSAEQMVGGLHRCKNGYIMITTFTENQWQGLIKLMGYPKWAEDEICKDEFNRAKYHKKINKLIAEWMKNFTKEEIYHRAQALDSSIGFVATVEDIINSKQFQARDYFIEVEHSKMGKMLFPTAPYRFSQTPWSFERPAPLLGEHNQEIYCNRLGFSKEDLIRLSDNKII